MGGDVLAGVKAVPWVSGLTRGKALVPPCALPGTADLLGDSTGGRGPWLGVLGLSPVPGLLLPFCCGREP